MPGPILYSSDKAVPWNYGADVYHHGVKQDLLVAEDKVTGSTDPDVGNIIRTSKIIRSGSVFSPEISPLTITTTSVHIPTAGSTCTARGKEKVTEPSRMEASSKDVTIEDPSR